MRGKHFVQDGNNSLQATLKLLLKYASFKLSVSSWAGSVEVWAQMTLRGHNEVGHQNRFKITISWKKDSGTEGFGNRMQFSMQLNN